MVTIAIATTSCALANLASASVHTGTVASLELWQNGNVAFTLNGSALPCNGQVIINGGSDGARNMYAALLAAKIAGKSVQLNTGACGPATGYNPSVLYATVVYLYVLD
jgi:hypothetical protein